jgi:hypothetical protein
VKGFLLIWAAMVTGCGGWSAPQAAPGPVPLGPPGKPIARLKREKSTFETTLTEVLWNDGGGPVKAADRVKTIMDAAPKQLVDRLSMTRKGRNVAGEPFDQPLNDGKAVVVSLNPDVVIVSVGEWIPSPLKPGDPRPVFSHWGGRWQIVQKKDLDTFGYYFGTFWTYAGTLVPWAHEMYAFSPDPGVEFRRLKFENSQATVPLPKGELVLRRRGIDVDVSRE